MPLIALALTLVPAAPQLDAPEVVRRSESLLARAKSVRGAYTIVRGGAQARVEFALQKPNRLAILSPGRADLFDGQEHTVADLTARTYARKDATLYGTPYVIGFENFLDRNARVSVPAFTGAEVVMVGTKSYVRRSAGNGAMTVDLDPQTALPARWSWRTGGETIQAAFDEVTLDAEIPAEMFDVAAATRGFTVAPTEEERALLAVGSRAPTTEGTTLQGRDLNLGEFVAGRRATVVAFINPNTQASADGFAALGALARRRDLRNIGVVAVSSSGDAKATRQFERNCRFEPPTFYGAKALSAMSAFGVRISPTFVVLDPEGRVRAATIGYDERAILAALDAKASG